MIARDADTDIYKWAWIKIFNKIFLSFKNY